MVCHRSRTPFSAEELLKMRQWKAKPARKRMSIRCLSRVLKRNFEAVRCRLQLRRCVSKAQTARTKRDALLRKEVRKSVYSARRKKPNSSATGATLGVNCRTARRILKKTVDGIAKRRATAAEKTRNIREQKMIEDETQNGPTEIDMDKYSASQRSQGW